MRCIGAIGCLLVLCVSLFGSGSVHAQLDRLRKHQAPLSPPVSDTPSIVIPAGEFLMGAAGQDALEDEKPQHPVWLDRFDIDLHEVTTAQYADFLAQEPRTVPWQWDAVDFSQHHDRSSRDMV